MKIHFPLQTKDISVTNRKRRPVFFLISGMLFFALFAALVYSYAPTSQISISLFSIPLLPVFITLLFMTLFCFGTYAFRSKTHGFLIGTFIVVYLLFRIHNLTHPFFFILLFALFLTLELFVSYRK